MKHAGLTGTIIGAAMEVHRTLGPGYVESVYKHALIYELGLRCLSTKTESESGITHKDQLVGSIGST